MKKILAVVWMLVFLAGCSASSAKLDKVLDLRSRLAGGEASFQAKITADYGDVIHKFTMDCRYEPSGKLTFTVVQPESIAGICGYLEEGAGSLTFDEAILSFAPMADGQLSPVAAPWIILRALHSGYITASGMEATLLRATIRDSYADHALATDIWISEENIPVRGEILWENRRILTVELKDFTIG